MRPVPQLWDRQRPSLQRSQPAASTSSSERSGRRKILHVPTSSSPRNTGVPTLTCFRSCHRAQRRPGAAIVSLLHAARASVEATVVSLERAVGAELSVHDSQEEAAAQLVGDRRAEAHRHARRTHVLTSGLHSATNDVATYVRQVRGRGALRAPRAGRSWTRSTAGQGVICLRPVLMRGCSQSRLRRRWMSPRRS